MARTLPNPSPLAGRDHLTAIALILPAAFALSAPSVAAAPEDYESGLGRLDPQILCDASNPPKSQDKEGQLEPGCLEAFADVVSRSGDNLTFKLDNGKTKLVRSNTKACEQIPIGACIVYRLVGYLQTSRQFVVLASEYESATVQLISRRTGAVTELEGYPRLSPSGRERRLGYQEPDRYLRQYRSAQARLEVSGATGI